MTNNSFLGILMLCWVFIIGRKWLKNILWVPASLRAKCTAEKPSSPALHTAEQGRLVLAEGDTHKFCLQAPMCHFK